MKVSETRLLWLLTIALVSVIFLGNFVFLLNSSHFHDSEFRKLGVNSTIGGSAVSFVNGRGDLSHDFAPSEASHLADVRSLFSKVRLIYYLSLTILVVLVFYLLLTGRFNYIIPRAFIRSGLFSLVLLALLFAVSSAAFGSFFSALHRPFFASGTWSFPAESLLIRTFPEQYFRDFTFNLVRLVFVNSAVFFGIGVFVRRKLAGRKPK